MSSGVDFTCDTSSDPNDDMSPSTDINSDTSSSNSTHDDDSGNTSSDSTSPGTDPSSDCNPLSDSNIDDSVTSPIGIPLIIFPDGKSDRNSGGVPLFVLSVLRILH